MNTAEKIIYILCIFVCIGLILFTGFIVIDSTKPKYHEYCLQGICMTIEEYK